MREARRGPLSLVDDLDFLGLAETLEQNVDFLKRDNQRLPEVLQFGPRSIPRLDYVVALQHLLEQLKADDSGKAFVEAVERDFHFFEVYGDKRWGEIFLTAYFEPILKASSRSQGGLTQPLYRPPQDLVAVQLNQFAERFPHWSLFADFFAKTSPRDSILRGRLVSAHVGTGGLSNLVPYFDREDIDGGSVLRGRGLELAWVDPVDAFFLHIQGSGTLEFENGRQLRVGYAGQNGHPYVPIGRYLLDVIERDKMSLQRIEAHLRHLAEGERRQLMFKNPSYIFFQELKGKPLTFMGTEVIEGRTIATDTQYFPKGALAFLEFPKPLFASPDDIDPKAWQPSSRFVLDQDTGGAIRGPHRVDLFWGRGESARQAAGVMRHPGRLFYLVPKVEFLDSLKLSEL